jgi:hypothetical protein
MNIKILGFFVALAPLLGVACGGGSSGSTDGTGGNGNGGSTATDTGGGGNGGDTGTGGAVGGSGGGTSTATTGGGGTGGMTTTSTGGTGGTGGNPATGACTNDPDQAVLMSVDIQAAVKKCAEDNFGGEPGTKDCIKMIGLSDGCTTCFDDTIQCVVSKCFNECAFSPDSAECATCRATNCDPAFETCSGLDAAP